MSDEPLRQPSTFWQWLTSQPGTLFVPPPAPVIRVNPPRTALDALETQLARIHDELSSWTSLEGVETRGYLALVASLDKLHDELVRRSKEESK